jgi:serpin B
VLLAVVAIVTGACDSGKPTSPPASAVASPSAIATISPTAELPSASASVSPSAPASASPSPSAPPASLASFVRGDAAETVSAGLRVRSRPRVAGDSLKFEPLLPLGTKLAVLGGPVTASGYTWYDVAPIGVQLQGGIGHGWVAVADSDGTPWVGIASTPGLQLATATSSVRVPATASAARTQAAAINAFGLELYQRMLRTSALGLAGKGVAISPVSISMALAMADAGATGTTATDLARLLRVRDWNQLSAGMGALDRLLAARDASWMDSNAVAHELSLRLANMAFAQQGWVVKPAFLDRISRTFGSGFGLVDYINDTPGARGAINDWVARQTLGRIPQILGPRDLSDLTRLVLVNAVYLKANWAREFAPEDTASHAFTRLDGSSVSVPTMHLVGEQDIVLARGAGWQATELPYVGAGGTTPLAMTLILPDNLKAFEASMTTTTLATVQAGIKSEQAKLAKVSDSGQDICGTYPYAVSLSLPKFGVSTRADLVPTLKAMGLTVATDPGRADFSGIASGQRSHIGAVIHQANLDVDEKGTVAAAATVVEIGVGGCTGPDPAKTVALRFNRPFIFLVRDQQTGAILFMGRVTDPSAK